MMIHKEKSKNKGGKETKRGERGNFHCPYKLGRKISLRERGMGKNIYFWGQIYTLGKV